MPINSTPTIKAYKPDSMWKAIRNKQRKAYAQGLLDAYEILSGAGSTEELNADLEKLLERYDEVDRDYEG